MYSIIIRTYLDFATKQQKNTRDVSFILSDELPSCQEILEYISQTYDGAVGILSTSSEIYEEELQKTTERLRSRNVQCYSNTFCVPPFTVFVFQSNQEKYVLYISQEIC